MFLLRELKKKRTIGSFLLAFMLLGLFLDYSDLKEVLRKIKEVHLLPLSIAFFLHYSTYFFRGSRWKKIFHKWNLQASSLVLGKIVLIFQCIDCIIPAKIGDLYGAHLMKINYGLSRSVSLGSIVLWRFLDALITVALCATATIVLFGLTIPSVMTSLFHWWIALIIVAVALAGLFLYKSHWLLGHLPETVRGLFKAFGEGLKPDLRTIPALVILTVAIWLFEAARFYFVCLSINVAVSIWAVIVITTSAAMATAIPFTPAGLGAVEFFMLSIMTLLSIPGRDICYTIILLDRIVSYWSQIPIGFVAMGISGYSGIQLWNKSYEAAPEVLPRG
jgi:uncharacterized protein (TIRG00374 family)